MQTAKVYDFNKYFQEREQLMIDLSYNDLEMAKLDEENKRIQHQLRLHTIYRNSILKQLGVK